MLVIGNEILSGATQDLNMRYLAKTLEDWGIALREARIVRDEMDAIKTAVLFLSENYDYVFTSGGIGPTHDDISTSSIAAAFKVPLYCHPEALRAMEERAAKRGGLSEVSKRMTYVPEGAQLIENDLSAAPGFQLHNVYVMAGVPVIFQSMLRSLLTKITRQPGLHEEILIIGAAESCIATQLGRLQRDYPAIEIGSYPQMDESGEYLVKVTLRSYARSEVHKCVNELKKHLEELGLVRDKGVEWRYVTKG